MDHLKNQKLIKTTNMIAIFSLIRKHREISKADIARITKLSPTTVSYMVRRMEDMGLVEEKRRGVSSGGRKPTLMSVSYDRGYVASVDIEFDSMSVGVYNLGKKMVTPIRSVRISDRPFNGDIPERMAEEIDEALYRAHVGIDSLFGITVGVRGIMDLTDNVMVTSTVNPDLQNANIFEAMISRYNAPVYIENATNLLAVAEKELVPRYSGKNSLVFLEVGVGVGAGIILDNTIFYGKFGGAGEIGHVTVDVNGPACGCGGIGCLEVLSCAGAVLQRTREELKSNGSSVLNEYIAKEGELSLRMIGLAAEQGDTVACRAIAEEAKYLTAGVLNIINAYNPEVIVLGGPIKDLGHLLMDQIRENVRKTVFGFYLEEIEMNYSRLTDESKLDGAALIAINRFFAEPDRIFSNFADEVAQI